MECPLKIQKENFTLLHLRGAVYTKILLFDKLLHSILWEGTWIYVSIAIAWYTTAATAAAAAAAATATTTTNYYCYCYYYCYYY